MSIVRLRDGIVVNQDNNLAVPAQPIARCDDFMKHGILCPRGICRSATQAFPTDRGVSNVFR